MSEITEFEIGQDLCWLQGFHSHRVGMVLEMTDTKVKLQGVTKDYWISKEVLLDKVNRPYPRAGMFMQGVN